MQAPPRAGCERKDNPRADSIREIVNYLKGKETIKIKVIAVSPWAIAEPENKARIFLTTFWRLS